jgi:aspartate/methionine/tyrosine aminotransferase
MKEVSARFSNRIHWDLRPNRISQLLAEKRATGVHITDLTESNPTNIGLEYPVDEILHALRKTEALRYEPNPRGLLKTREAVAQTYDPAVDPDRIILTASTSEAYSFLFKLLADPGDEVLVPRPSYPLFEFLATLESVNVVQYPLHYFEEWTIDTHALATAVTPRTRAVVLVNPNNPTGSYLKRSELDALVEICGANNLALISDEVFADYAFGPDDRRVRSIAGVNEVLTFSLSGLSKMAALPQMKLGWIVVNGPDAVRSEALARLELIADTFLSVGAPVQHAARELLTIRNVVQNQIRSRTEANLSHLRKVGVRLLNVEGGWYATVQVPRTRTEEQWTLHLLDNYNTLVQPGYFYDFDSEAFLILSLLGDQPSPQVVSEIRGM